MKRFLAVLLIALLLILPVSCGAAPALLEESYDKLNESISPVIDAALHKPPADVKKLKKMAAGGIIELYCDPTTFAVSVKETVSGQYWHSLPSYVAGQTDSAAPVSLTVRSENERYYWNVQDNSVAFGKASSEPIADGSGVLVAYDCYLNAQEAQSSSPSMGFRVELRCTITDGSLVVQANWRSLVPDSQAVLERMGVLEYFGAYTKSGANDFLLLPDGSGAVVKTAKEDKTFAQALSFQVYGPDRATPSPNYSYSAILPVFGIRRGSSGFAAYIEQGDAIATITADRQREDNSLNSVGACFDITPSLTEKKGSKTVVYSSTGSYSEPVCIRYRFLSGSAASYSGMAGALREQMMRSRLLPNRSVENQEKIPVNISLTATARIKGLFEYTKTMATAEQAEELLSLLKGKGIDNVFMQLLGATTRGDSVRVLSRVGGNDAYSALQKNMQAQNMRLFLDIPFLTGNGGERAESLYGKSISIPYTNAVSTLYGAKQRTYTLRAMESLDDVTERLLLSMRELEPMGLSLGDLDAALCSDYSDGGRYNRQQSVQKIREQLTALSTERKLMVPGGNFYLLYNASVVTELPSAAVAHTESAAYVSIPLVQMLLHGLVDYSFTPLNLEEDKETALLKSIAYGAIPAFSWAATVPNGSSGAVDALDYENGISFAAAASEKASLALADLRGSRITDHTVYKTGVSGTTYETGAVVYVNSSAKAAEVNGLTIPAKSFLRVN
ncbi:MAG: DUF5696 domain-containing protein [Clostridium sp.]|jgi:hypothetical protein|nr:DUF5696 domain-containing protein [Clostridium sp.]